MRQLCAPHYQRWRKHGDVKADQPIRPPMAPLGECRVDGCSIPDVVRGYCPGHYARTLRNGGDPGPAAFRRYTEQSCTVDGCDRDVLARQMCRMHYERFRKHGDTGPGHRLLARAGSGGTSRRFGYRKLWIDGRLRPEHRVIMEQLLGRPLLPTETVHHINGDRQDNRTDGPLVNFRSGNLELWAHGQPAGQRVEDRVAHALDVLRTYRPEVLIRH